MCRRTGGTLGGAVEEPICVLAKKIMNGDARRCFPSADIAYERQTITVEGNNILLSLTYGYVTYSKNLNTWNPSAATISYCCAENRMIIMVVLLNVIDVVFGTLL